MHADFLQLCILGRTLQSSCHLLETEDVFEVSPSKTSVTPSDFFLYCYYGGMAAAGMKMYPRSIELLLQAVTAPAVAGNGES